VFQDTTAGIQVYDTHLDALPNNLLPRGARVIVRGARGNAYGKPLNAMQIGSSDAANQNPVGIKVVSTGNTLPSFQTITSNELETNSLSYESELVRINNCSISSGSWPTSGSGLFEIDDGSGSVTVYIDQDTGISPHTETTFEYIQGIATNVQKGSTGSEYRDPRLMPREDGDIATPTAVQSPWSLYE